MKIDSPLKLALILICVFCAYTFGYWSCREFHPVSNPSEKLGVTFLFDTATGKWLGVENTTPFNVTNVGFTNGWRRSPTFRFDIELWSGVQKVAEEERAEAFAVHLRNATKVSAEMKAAGLDTTKLNSLITECWTNASEKRFSELSSELRRMANSLP